jgi:hypothetical protein
MVRERAMVREWWDEGGREGGREGGVGRLDNLDLPTAN